MIDNKNPTFNLPVKMLKSLDNSSLGELALQRLADMPLSALGRWAKELDDTTFNRLFGVETPEKKEKSRKEKVEVHEDDSSRAA